MSNHSHFWTCPVPGCPGRGAGYGSGLQAAAARRRHIEHGNLTHRQQLQAAAGGAR